MLCKGGFPSMETDEMNYEILKSVTKSLNENGKCMLTALMDYSTYLKQGMKMRHIEAIPST